MSKINRRTFISGSSLLTAGAISGLGFSINKEDQKRFNSLQSIVKFTRDGLDLSPTEYATILYDMKDKIAPDHYTRGGVIEDLEKKFAGILGKESAIFMPTGTMANHIAIRKLAGVNKKVIVQADSHISRDSGDCATELSGVTLVNMNPGQPSFSYDDLMREMKRLSQNRVKKPVGAISIESPVRRHDNKVFPFEEMKKISAYARQQGIGMHLDGARLFNASAHTGIGIKQYTGLFDTVYVSMYKDFNAPSGAILAGSNEFINNLYNTRRMFGGGMPQSWPFAVIPLKYADSFTNDYKLAMKNAEILFELLSSNKSIKIETIKNGTNVFKLHLNSFDPEIFRETLIKKGIELPKPSGNIFTMKINPTLNRKAPEWIANQFEKAITEA